MPARPIEGCRTAGSGPPLATHPPGRRIAPPESPVSVPHSRPDASTTAPPRRRPVAAPVLGALARGHDNNFNLLRMGAASMVLLSHCWPLTQGTLDHEPGWRWLGVELGRLAVWVFFAISGFLVSASWQRQPTVRRFLVARARRIVPGLLTMLVLLVFGLGAAATVLPLAEYLRHRQTWGYLFFNGTLLVDMRWTLPGVFDGAGVNGSLWTLPVELRCYLGLALLGAAGGLRHGLAYAAAAVLLAMALALRWLGTDTAPLVLSFVAGSAAWHWRDRLPLDARVALLLVCAAAWAMNQRAPAGWAVGVVALAYGSLVLALVPSGGVRRFNELGDWSYGVYIYAFPIQVALCHAWPALGVWGLFATAWPLTLVAAAASWHFVERPALARPAPVVKPC